jgi:hypothetical protein
VDESSQVHFDCLGSFSMAFPLCKWLGRPLRSKTVPRIPATGV